MAAVKTAVVTTQTEILHSPYNKPTTLPPPPPPAPAPALESHKDGSVRVEEIGSRPVFRLEEHPIDQVRPIKVGVIGGGLSGVTAGILLPAKLPGLDLRIYDKNADLVCPLPIISCCSFLSFSFFLENC